MISKGKKLLEQGNAAEARQVVQGLLDRPAAETGATAEEVHAAMELSFNGMQKLGRAGDEVDAFLEAVLVVHGGNWRVLQEATECLASVNSGGSMVDGRFARQNWSGPRVDSSARDWVQMLRWMRQASTLVVQDPGASASVRAEVMLAEAGLVRRGREAWELQVLTDLTVLPELERSEEGRGGRLPWGRGGYGGQGEVGYPVQAEGQPVYFKVPASWEAAVNDGERWRFLLRQAGETDPASASKAALELASVLSSWLDVSTLRGSSVWEKLTGPEEQDGESQVKQSILDLPTLKDEETIVRLATGIRRLTLPPDQRFMDMLRETGSGNSDVASQALRLLATSLENRRQRDRAVEVWREIKKRFWRDRDIARSADERLEQLTGALGKLEPREPQPAGTGAKVDMVFRNAPSVKLTARPVKVAELLETVRAEFRRRAEGKSARERREWTWLNQAFGSLLQDMPQLSDGKFLGDEVAKWEVALTPAARHEDRRITLETPLDRAGLYLLEANFPGSGRAHCLVEVADLVLFTQNLTGGKGTQGFVVDAVTGRPVSGVKVASFGYREEYQDNRNRPRVVWYTREQQVVSGADGRFELAPDDDKGRHFSFFLEGVAPDGRRAMLGLDQLYGYGRGFVPPRPDSQPRVFVVSDRPVYRPGDKVELAAWVRRASYEEGKTGNDFAGKTFTCQVRDPRGEKVLEETLTADENGALKTRLDLGATSTLGVYQVQFFNREAKASGGLTLRVEEYKKPEFEVLVKTPEKPVLLGEAFEVKVEAKYYFGGPVKEARVKYKVERVRHDAGWFPVRPWDWLYGAGYWWRNNDYDWLPGYAGCISYWPTWWHRPSDPPEVVAEATVPIGVDGTVKIPLDSSVAKALHGDQDHKYRITAEVTDSSRRTIVGNGSVVVPRQPYQVYVWTDRGFYQTGGEARVSVQARLPDGSPVEGKAVLRVLGVNYQQGEKPVETEKVRFELSTRDGAPAVQVVSLPQAGQYRLAVEFDDGHGHKVTGMAMTHVRGGNFDGRGVRFPDLEVVAEKSEYAPGEEASFVLNLAQEGGSAYVFDRVENGLYGKPRLLTLAEGRSTTFKLKLASGDQPNVFVEVVTVHGAKLHRRVVQVPVPPARRMATVAMTPSQETYKPRSEGTVQVQLTGTDGKPVTGQVILAGYDKSLEYISGGSPVQGIREFFWGWKRAHRPAARLSLEAVQHGVDLPGGRDWEPIGMFGSDDMSVDSYSGGGASALRKSATMQRSVMAVTAAPAAPAPVAEAMPAAGAVADSIDGLVAGEGGSGEEAPVAMIRQDFADALVWQVAMADETGRVTVPVKFPDDLTTWKLRAWALGPNTEVGEVTAEVISRKDLLIRMQAPRFFVERDEVVLSGIVHNELKQPQAVRALLELDGKTLAPLQGQALEQRMELAAGAEHRFDWRVEVLQEGEAVVRMKALAAGESDAVERKFPVLVHGMERQDAWSLAVRAGEERGVVEFEVPEKRRPAQTRLEVRYSPSLAMAMVDALPFLVAYPHGCTEQTLNRFVPTVVTQRVLLDLRLDLKAIRDKRANLNAQELGDPARRAAQWQRYKDTAPVFDEQEMARMVKAGLERLEAMQARDGGWGWWPGAEEGSVHITAQVVDGLLQAKAAGAEVPAGMLSRGLDWLEQQENAELVRLRLPKIAPRHKEHPDDEDALTHGVLVAGGKGSKDMRERLFEHRLKLSKSMQAQVGMACATLKEHERRDLVIRNLEQFQKQDGENQTAWLDFGAQWSWWRWQDDDVETMAAYLRLRLLKDPKDTVAPQLVKYLLNHRKHGTYWKSTRDTAAVVTAFAAYLKATNEGSPDMLVEVWLDGRKVKEAPINKDNLFSYDHALVLSGAELTTGKHTLEIRRKGGGALYANAYLTCFTLEDHLRAAGLEVKVKRNLYRLVPEAVKDVVAGGRGQALQQQGARYRREPLPEHARVVSGDLLEVELITESKNDYEYLMLQDPKPAGCEAVDLRSGYFWNQGLGAYREFRDQKVTFYIEHLPRGRHVQTYRVRAEIPGQFSALPSVIEGMYAPELKGNAEERRVEVADRPVQE